MADVYEELIAKTRYARYLDDLQRREHWPETVKRYFDFMEEHLMENHGFDMKPYRLELESAVVAKQVMPSMRALMTAGPALKRQNACGYNCSAVAIDDPKAFDELMYLSLCSAGVGFSVERQFINKLPEIPEQLFDSQTTIVVSDSKEGWAKGLRMLIALLYSGEIPKWDLSKLRPAGSRLKTFGGRSSGPGVLDNLFHQVIAQFKKAAGRKLYSIECHDLCCWIAECSEAGGSRRAALLSLSNLSDDRMRKAKSGDWYNSQPQRSWANNSAVYTEKPEIGKFMEEWLALYESKSGERGIFNREAANRQVKGSRRKPHEAWLTNPCQKADAQLLTPQGIRQLGDLSIGDTIWSGSQWTRIVDKWCTGVKPVYRYDTTAGFVEATENHRIVQNGVKVELKDAAAIDTCVGPSQDLVLNSQDVMDGWVLGDGTYHKASRAILLNVGQNDLDIFESEVANFVLDCYNKFYNYKVKTTLTPEELPPLPYREIPQRIMQAPASQVAGFLRGLYSANGSVVANRVTLKSCCKKLINQTQQLLSSLGITSYYTTNLAHSVKFANGEYTCKESYDLNIGSFEGKSSFRDLIGFVQPYKQEKLLKLLEGKRAANGPKVTYDIKEVTYVGDHEVFDITVDAPEHTYWCNGMLVSNCGEIQLRNMGFCNLTEVVIRPEDTEETLAEKVRLATILGTFQSTLTHFPYLRSQWRKNAEEERLLGVSFTGIMDNVWMNSPSDPFLPERLRKLKQVAIDTNAALAEQLGINPSAAITTIKPSGNVSQLVSCSSGIHAAWSKYWWRTVRCDNKDPIVEFLKEKGVKWEPCQMRPHSTTIFYFPRKASDCSVTRDQLDVIAQLELWKIYKLNWAEHNVSCTISVREDEWLKCAAWVYENFDHVLGLSFLPDDGGFYPQMPYQSVTEEQYLELLAQTPSEINWDEMIEISDNVEGARQAACSAGFCEL